MKKTGTMLYNSPDNMVKKVYISILALILTGTLAFILPSCSGRIDQAAEEIEELKMEIAGLRQDIELKQEELQDHDILTRNLNRLLETVYYGSASPIEGGREKNFTAFAMHYREEFYLITAGHCIEYDSVTYTDFRFKSNYSGSWVYPELLYYEADYENNRDFAVFSHRLITRGLIIEEEDKEPRYVLGNIERKLNLFREFDTAREGESGSPILSRGCRLVGIVIKNNSEYTPISDVTDAIDRLPEE
jgi:hypothetical protein